ncbi:MAG: DUF5662 family protein [Chloroflexota bacterium]
MKKILFMLVLLWTAGKVLKISSREWNPARHWAYFKYVLRHKWFVFEECIKLGVPLYVAIFHDWDKFLSDEWTAYAQAFYGRDGTKRYIEHTAFIEAWNAHQKRNKHHWQYWIMDWGNDKGVEILEMPDLYRREMLADWRGAGRAITGDDNTLDWYTNNREYIKIHPKTRKWVEAQLGYEPEKVEQ